MDYNERKIGADAADRLRKECSTGDPASDHVQADLIIEETLRELGLLRLANAYHNVRKVYE